MAVANYNETYGSLPPAYVADANGRPMHSWRVLILPFLDRNDLYQRYDFSLPWDSPKNRALLNERPRTFALTALEYESSPVTNYLLVTGPETLFPGAKAMTLKDCTDGISSTVMVVENVGANVLWTEPRDLELSSMSLATDGTPTSGISSVYQPAAFVTPSANIHMLSPSWTPDELRRWITRSGGEKLFIDEFGTLEDGRLRPLR